MINDSIIEAIQQLLKTAKSQREIARQVGVSRGTVQAVALGKRVPKDEEFAVFSQFWVAPDGDPKRCSKCGALTTMPCLACQIYELNQNNECKKFFSLKELSK